MNSLILALSLIFGLIPLNRTSKNSSFLIDYAFMIAAPIAYFVSYYLILFEENFGVYQLTQCNSICRLGNILFMHLGCFLYFFIQLISLRRGKNFFIIFEKSLNEIDETIEKCHQLSNEKKATTSVKRRYGFYLTWIVVSLAFGYALYYDGMQMFWKMGNRFIVSIMTTAFPFLTGSIVQGQFICYVSVIIDRFNKINNLFEAINHECERKNVPITIFDIENSMNKDNKNTEIINTDAAKEKSDSSSSNEEENDEQHPNEGVLESRHKSENNLMSLFKLHDKILSLSVITNAEFGGQCVPYMTVCFVIGIFGIFLETKVIFVVGGMNKLLDYTAQIYVLWSVIMSMVAYLVLRLCCNANGKSKNSAMIVHEIMQKKPAFMLGNDLYYNKMKAFTLQFLHWEGFFHFNGIGLFALDYTFIFSTVSAATSYLIVLLQFDMSAILKTEGLL